MSSYYSILKYVNNSLSDENIAIGLVAISNGKVFFQLSERKIGICKKLNPKANRLVDFSLKQFSNYLEIDRCSDDRLFSFSKSVDIQFLERLHAYNNGILQFSKPSFIKVVFDDNIFESYFERLISSKVEIDNKDKKINTLRKQIELKICQPLRDKIDIDYTIKKNILPSLFFNFTFDAIGANGSIYAARAVDFNKYSTTDPIEKILSEYESVIDRLNEKAEDLGLNSNGNQYFLITENYAGTNKNMRELYELIEHNQLPKFKKLQADKSEYFTDLVISKHAKKLSEQIEMNFE
ncbi:MAG: hypothetical protein J0L80_07115 [Chitinophagales bacterium]|nr:hypothetical protein [Chitinophagales bacterium]